MKTAVIYARYSSDSQTEQSIEGQLRVCEEYAQKNNILILNTYNRLLEPRKDISSLGSFAVYDAFPDLYATILALFR